MKLFRRNQNKDVEKPVVTYYAKYLGVLGSNKSLPTNKSTYVHIYEDKVVVELLKSKSKTAIPYKNMTDIQNVDAGNKVDLERVIGLGVMTAGIGSIVGYFRKRQAIITVIKYSDDESKPQTIALDFIHDTKYAQPIIDIPKGVRSEVPIFSAFLTIYEGHRRNIQIVLYQGR
jgi:hypothetical protein